MTSLSPGDQYIANGNHYAEIGGKPVYGSVALRFQAATSFTIDGEFRGPLQQYIGVRARNRKIRMDGRAAERWLIADSAEFPIPGELFARKPPFELDIWNAWSGPHGAGMAWVANGGMKVEEFDSSRIVLVCNAGQNPLEFRDARITVAWPSTSFCELVLPGAI